MGDNKPNINVCFRGETHQCHMDDLCSVSSRAPPRSLPASEREHHYAPSLHPRHRAASGRRRRQRMCEALVSRSCGPLSVISQLVSSLWICNKIGRSSVISSRRVVLFPLRQDRILPESTKWRTWSNSDPPTVRARPFLLLIPVFVGMIPLNTANIFSFFHAVLLYHQ